MFVMEKIIIIGGGAAGLACAIAAATRLRAQGQVASVEVFERDDRVGRTILATGNGRCNFSNSQIDMGLYRNGAFVEGVLRQVEESCPFNGVNLNDDAVHRFFGDLGLVWREEQDGRQYPLANKASSVLDVLRAAAARLGVVERCNSVVSLIDPPRKDGAPYTLRMADGSFERASALVVACGGGVAVDFDAAGWSRPRTRPVLGPLATETGLVKELNNIRVRAAVSLVRPSAKEGPKVVAVERGEVMFRKYGVSGIAVFNLSRYAEPGDVLSIDFLSEVFGSLTPRDPAQDASAVAVADPSMFDLSANAAKARGFCFGRARGLREAGADTYGDFLNGLVLPQVGHVLLRACGLSGDAPVTKAGLRSLADALSGFTLAVSGIGDESNCQVRRGGFDVLSVDPRTMESNRFPQLYFAGEVLDVDGPCGGYNLHWAWASGMLAGVSAADSLLEHPFNPDLGRH